jgi:hypothetical protein
MFVAEERGSHKLKGVPEPVTLFRIVRASGAGRRAGQRHLTPLVGRDEEICSPPRRAPEILLKRAVLGGGRGLRFPGQAQGRIPSASLRAGPALGTPAADRSGRFRVNDRAFTLPPRQGGQRISTNQ